LFPWSRRNRRRVPKQFLAPRPMASAALRQHPFWDLVTLELLAFVVASSLLVTGAFGTLDRFVYDEALELTASGAPSDDVVVVLVSPQALATGNCSATVTRTLKDGDASLGVLLDPLVALCAPEGTKPHAVALGLGALSNDASGRVRGLVPGRLAPELRTRLPLGDDDLVAPRTAASMPMLALAELETGRVPVRLLRDKIVLLALDSAELGDARSRQAERAAETGAVLAAAVRDRPRRVGGLGWVIPLALLLFALTAATQRRPRFAWVPRFIPSFSPWLLLGVLTVVSGFGAFGLGPLLPVPSLAISALLFVIVMRLPAALAARRARAGASKLLGETSQLAAGTGYLLAENEFWARMARRVEQTHPADGVLVAELPPFSWRLRVWPNGDLNESIIKERRRDVRRTPFVDEAGARRAKIVEGFLVMNEVPCVFAPLEAAGELEGFLILIGKPAARAFLDRPHVTERLADELAQLILSRRLDRTQADDWRRPAGMLVEPSAEGSGALIEHARSALEDLELFDTVFQSAPVGLLYADAFGDVRMLGREFVDGLRAAGVALSVSEDRASLAPGKLPLSRVLAAISSLPGAPSLSLAEVPPGGQSFEIELEDGTRYVALTLRRLERGGKPNGFLCTLSVLQRRGTSSIAPEPMKRLPERGDPLTVFSLAELATDVVEAIARDLHTKLRFQTPRVPAHVIGHRRELTEALTGLLRDVATSQPGNQGPVLTIKERRHWVELTLIDLTLGVPEPAMQRTVLAPSIPPPGLEPLATFVQAVEESHGEVRMSGEKSWGTKLTVSLLRARPRVTSSTLGRLIRLSEAPGVKRK
jgi:hypothetical protein